LGWIVQRASRKTLPISNSLDAPSNCGSTLRAELIRNVFAAFADSYVDLGIPSEFLDIVVVDRQRNPVRASGSLFAGVAMANPNKQRAV
jgi:hypothetical protein